MKEVFYVVGDKYSSMCQCNTFKAITYSELMEKVSEGKMSDKHIYITGQGLCEERIAGLRTKGIEFANEELKPAELNDVHKHKAENVLITAPHRRGDDQYIAQLRVDDRCAELSDHVTGVHINGIILIEAARQMTLACMEAYCVQESLRQRSRFVWNDCSIRYTQFIYPVDVYILARLTSQRIKEEEKWQGVFDVAFWQKGKIGCEATIKMSAYKSQWLQTIEYEKASEVCKDVLAECLLAA